MRSYLFFLLCMFTFAAAGIALASNSGGARQYADNIGKQVLAVVNGSGAQADKQNQLRQLFSQNVDTDWMGRFVLGAGWQKINEDQRARYLTAYRQYLLERYTTNFSDYNGSKYTITGVKDEADGQYSVAMNINAPQAEQKEVKAGYRLRMDEAGSFKIIDIIIEGVSLITTQRSEFSSIMQQGGIDTLISKLDAKNAAK